MYEPNVKVKYCKTGLTCLVASKPRLHDGSRSLRPWHVEDCSRLVRYHGFRLDLQKAFNKLIRPAGKVQVLSIATFGLPVHGAAGETECDVALRRKSYCVLHGLVLVGQLQASAQSDRSQQQDRRELCFGHHSRMFSGVVGVANLDTVTFASGQRTVLFVRRISTNRNRCWRT